MTITPLQRVTVLVLNRQWVAVDAITPAEAFGHLAAGSARGVWMEDGTMQALEWEDWKGMAPKEPMALPPLKRIRNFWRVEDWKWFLPAME